MFNFLLRALRRRQGSRQQRGRMLLGKWFYILNVVKSHRYRHDVPTRLLLMFFGMLTREKTSSSQVHSYSFFPVFSANRFIYIIQHVVAVVSLTKQNSFIFDRTSFQAPLCDILYSCKI